MLNKHVRNKPRLVIKLTKLNNIQLEQISEAVRKSIKKELLHW